MNPEQDLKLRDLVEKLVELYWEVKGYVISSEKLSKRSRVSVPALNELRNAFDHNIRAEAVWRQGQDPKEGTEPNPYLYSYKNLEKATGHVYRAGYDALDIIALDRVRKINRYILDSFRITTLCTVMNSYSTRIREPLKKALELCNEAKLGKDVEPEKVDEHPAFFKKYKDAIESLEDILEELESHEPELLEVEKELAMEDEQAYEQYRASADQQTAHAKRARNWAIAGMVLTIVITIITFIIKH